MDTIDEFSKDLLEEAKRFLEKANEEPFNEGKNAFIHSAILIGFCALEAYINSISDELKLSKAISLIDRSILTEREIILVEGEFKLNHNLKIYRLEDRIQFLYRKYSGKKINKKETWWSDFKHGVKLRNNLVHPRDKELITLDQAKKTISSIITLIDILFKVIYKKKFPLAEKGLMSSKSF